MSGGGCLGVYGSSLFRGGRSSILWTTVRYARKPRWVPIAKSKMYKIREPYSVPPHEEQEIARLTNNYQIYNNSLWAFQKGLTDEEMARSQMAKQEVSEEAEWDRLVAETERDNAIVREIRKQRRVEEWKTIEAEIQKEKDIAVEKNIKAIEEAEEEVKIKMERLKLMITAENLDEEIQKALSTEVDYSFGIDKDGRLYRGRYNNSDPEDISTLTDCLDVQVRRPVSK